MARGGIGVVVGVGVGVSGCAVLETVSDNQADNLDACYVSRCPIYQRQFQKKFLKIDGDASMLND